MIDFKINLENNFVSLVQTQEEHFEELYKVGNNPDIWKQHLDSDRWKLNNFRKYIDGGLEVNQQDIKDFGINFGLGIPVGRLSKANLGFEFGQRGTDDFGLIKENYLNFMIGVSLNDLWFIKSMYN